MKHSEPLPRYINDLWVNWAISCLCLALPLVFSAFLTKIWVPVAMLLEVVCITMYMRNAGARQHPSSQIIPRLTKEVLMASVVLVLIINMVYNHHVSGIQVDDSAYNVNSPFVTVIVIMPLMALFGLIAILRRGRRRKGTNPSWTYRYTTNDEVIDQILRNEERFQMRLYVIIGTVLGFAAWVYYIFFFINVNINKPDILFFWVIPAGALAASIVYMTSRTYYVAFGYRRAEMDPRHRSNFTSLRFLIIKDDHIYLDDELEALTHDRKVDTPASIDISRCRALAPADAQRYFDDLTGLKDVQIRYLYSSGHRDLDNILHYAAFLRDDQDINPDRLEGRWFTFHGVQRLLNSRLASLTLAAEIARIYTVTMVWKTYDADGRRLYPIRSYQPTFRLRDFHTWDVDYDDPNWLRVASNNEDHFFFRLRKAWRRVKGHA